MTTDTNLMGLRAQIAANMRVVAYNSTAEVVTAMNHDRKWQALIVVDSKVMDQLEQWYDIKEAALEAVLEMSSFSVYCKFMKQIV